MGFSTVSNLAETFREVEGEDGAAVEKINVN